MNNSAAFLTALVYLPGSDEIRKLHGILDEEHRHIVADQIAIALIGVEFDRKTPHIAGSVSGTPLAATVENRTKTGVIFPSEANGAAFVCLVRGLRHSK